MRKVAFLATALFLSLAGTAQASTIDIILGSASDTVSYGTGGTLVANIDVEALPGFNWADAIAVPSASVSFPPGLIAPTGSLYNNKYLAVVAGGSVTFDLSSYGNTLGFTWGSISSSDKIVLTDSLAHSFAITGDELISELAGFGLDTDQANVIIKDQYAQIVSIKLVSSANSFEVANFQHSDHTAVPLPASAPMFGIALATLVFVGLRRRKAI